MNYDKIAPHAIRDAYVDIHDELKSIQYLIQEFPAVGFFDMGALSFYPNIPNGLLGTGTRSENGIHYTLMFDGNKLYDTITQVLNVIGEIPLEKRFRPFEEANLRNLQQGLKVIAEHNGLASFSWG